MTKEAAVRLLPDQTEIGVEGACVIMTDVLRASSTIVTALAEGAKSVVPCADIDATRELANGLASSGPVVLGGERNGVVIPGFDHGNSPLEYSADIVNGKTIVLCTTNGTWALEFCRRAKEILIGALINLEAIVQAAAEHSRVVVVCAGTDRKITGEDVLFAGGVMAGLARRFPDLELEPNGLKALAVWRDVSRYQADSFSTVGSHVAIDLDQPKHGYAENPYLKYLLSARGGWKLAALKYFDDIKYCATLNSHTVTPRLDEESWTIR